MIKSKYLQFRYTSDAYSTGFITSSIATIQKNKIRIKQYLFAAAVITAVPTIAAAVLTPLLSKQKIIYINEPTANAIATLCSLVAIFLIIAALHCGSKIYLNKKNMTIYRLANVITSLSSDSKFKRKSGQSLVKSSYFSESDKYVFFSFLLTRIYGVSLRHLAEEMHEENLCLASSIDLATTSTSSNKEENRFLVSQLSKQKEEINGLLKFVKTLMSAHWKKLPKQKEDESKLESLNEALSHSEIEPLIRKPEKNLFSQALQNMKAMEENPTQYIESIINEIFTKCGCPIEKLWDTDVQNFKNTLISYIEKDCNISELNKRLISLFSIVTGIKDPDDPIIKLVTKKQTLELQAKNHINRIQELTQECSELKKTIEDQLTKKSLDLDHGCLVVKELELAEEELVQASEIEEFKSQNKEEAKDSNGNLNEDCPPPTIVEDIKHLEDISKSTLGTS